MKLGDMGKMMKQVQKMQEDLAKMQETLKDMTVEATSGGGMTVWTSADASVEPR